MKLTLNYNIKLFSLQLYNEILEGKSIIEVFVLHFILFTQNMDKLVYVF